MGVGTCEKGALWREMRGFINVLNGLVGFLKVSLCGCVCECREMVPGCCLT